MGVMERFFVSVSCGLMIVLLVLIFFSEKGVQDWMGFNAEKRRIERENASVERENQELSRKIERLKQDLGYIEHIARHELEMVAEGELVFRFRNSEQMRESAK